MSLASSDSDNDFLEMCRARTFLAELEDDDELPEAEDECDENENEESNDKTDDDYDDVGVWIKFKLFVLFLFQNFTFYKMPNQ